MLRELDRPGARYIWDDDLLDTPDAGLFDPERWRERRALIGEAEGRGAAYILAGPNGRDWVLRHNRRGGLLAAINADRFLYTGMARTRPVRELRLLAMLREQGLPVPAPVAARVSPGLGFYRGDLITVRVPDAITLADRLLATTLAATAWQRLGQVIARFHAAGLWHADLNARNVLVDGQNVFHMIDFDKAKIHSGRRWQRANLTRLRRSLDKWRDAEPGFGFADADWAALRGGYASVSTGGA